MTGSPDAAARRSALLEPMHFLVVYGTIGFLSLLCLLLVVRAAQGGFAASMRSLAAVLLPIVVASFLRAFASERVGRFAGLPPAPAFALGAGAGAVVMAVVDATERSGIPIAELVVSASLAVLVFAGRDASQRPALASYYGTVTGALGYVILLGFPFGG